MKEERISKNRSDRKTQQRQQGQGSKPYYGFLGTTGSKWDSDGENRSSEVFTVGWCLRVGFAFLTPLSHI